MMMQVVRIFVLAIFISTYSLASEYTWSVFTSKKEAYVNEAIYLKYICTFNDKAELYSIEFTPEVDNETYSIRLYSQKTKLLQAKKISTYEYIAFVKKPMLAEFTFDVVMKKTNKDSIENTVLGRDNADYEEFLSTKVKLESIQIEIEKTDTKIAGEFSLTMRKDEGEKKAYEPFHLEIKIQGLGNFDAFKEIAFAIKDVKVFAQKPIKNIALNKNGYEGTWSQKFAFVGSQDFIIEQQKIEYFDIVSKSLKNLEISPIDVKVKNAYVKSELLDTEHKKDRIFLDFMAEYRYLIFSFIFGFLLAKLKFRRKRIDTKNTQLEDKINKANSLDVLSIILVLHNQKIFNETLMRIDRAELSLTQAKKKAIELIMET